MINKRIHPTGGFNPLCKTLFCTTMIICISNITTHATPPIDSEIKNIIEKKLNEQNRSVYQVPEYFNYEYNNAIETATESIDQFITIMNSIILPTEITDAINTTIKKRLMEENLSINDIPKSLKNDFFQKKKHINEDVERYLEYNNCGFIPKEELEEIVSYELDYSFMLEIQDQKKSGPSWGKAIVNVIAGATNIISTISSTVSSSSNTEITYEPTPSYNPESFEDGDHYPSAPDYPISGSDFYIIEHDQCSLCFNDFYTSDRIAVLSCGHMFHETCIKRHLKVEKICPYCGEKVILSKIYNNIDDMPL